MLISQTLRHPCSLPCQCRFRMVAIPGEAVVSTKVEPIKKFRKVMLASAATKLPLPLKRKSIKASVEVKKPVSSTIVQTTYLKKKLHMTGVSTLLIKDFTQ